MSKAEPFDLYELEESWSYLAWKKHAMEVQLLLGTHKLDDLMNESKSKKPLLRVVRAASK